MQRKVVGFTNFDRASCVQLVLCPGMVLAQVAINSRLSIQMNIATFQGIYVLFPTLHDAKQFVCPGDSEFHDTYGVILRKYRERGYTYVPAAEVANMAELQHVRSFSDGLSRFLRFGSVQGASDDVIVEQTFVLKDGRVQLARLNTCV